jgi:hypothetical protein
VRTSSADRLVLVQPRLTKGDVGRYYAAPADLALPHVAGWPLIVVRCPERLEQGCFYQRHRAAGMPASVRAAQAAGRDGKEPYLAIDDASGLLALIRLGAIELHPNGARADRLVFDLDSVEGLPFARVVAAARELRERLQQLGLASIRALPAARACTWWCRSNAATGDPRPRPSPARSPAPFRPTARSTILPCWPRRPEPGGCSSTTGATTTPHRHGQLQPAPPRLASDPSRPWPLASLGPARCLRLGSRPAAPGAQHLCTQSDGAAEAHAGAGDRPQ